MPTLRNPRHERFAQLLANGKTATNAYEQAGYSRNGGNGPALARTTEVQNRVTEIHEARLRHEHQSAAMATELAAITKADLIGMARDIYVLAKKSGQGSAAMAAVKEIGVLSGIRIERSERGQPGEFEWLEKLNTDELRLLADGKLDIDAYRDSQRVVN